MTPPETLLEFTRDARERFERAGIGPDEAALDAELLARSVLGGWTRGEFLVRRREAAPPSFAEAFLSLVGRRERREPTAYLTGRREFWNLEFDVTPDVLVPRPETELLVEEVLGRVSADSALRIADVGTGSGCLAVSLARWLPRARVVAVDASLAALKVAKRNALRLGAGDRVEFVQGDLMNGLRARFDVIVSNPPYVPTAEIRTLQPEVSAHEPTGALDGGPEGVSIIERLLPDAAGHLLRDGLLVFEFGFGQAARIRALVSSVPGLELLDIRNDFSGIPRAAIARARGTSPEA